MHGRGVCVQASKQQQQQSHVKLVQRVCLSCLFVCLFVCLSVCVRLQVGPLKSDELRRLKNDWTKAITAGSSSGECLACRPHTAVKSLAVLRRRLPDADGSAAVAAGADGSGSAASDTASAAAGGTEDAPEWVSCPQLTGQDSQCEFHAVACLRAICDNFESLGFAERPVMSLPSRGYVVNELGKADNRQELWQYLQKNPVPLNAVSEDISRPCVLRGTPSRGNSIALRTLVAPSPSQTLDPAAALDASPDDLSLRQPVFA
jgi:hypothetical protein